MPDIKLRDLRYLVAVADTQHFGRAATACHVSQPTLSAQLKKLEASLGVQLIERGPRRASLTAAGRRIVARARTEAHKLIEEAMLAANVCSADFVALAGHPALYRVHEGPTPEKRLLLQNYLRALGVPASLGDDPKPRELAAIAAQLGVRLDALDDV